MDFKDLQDPKLQARLRDAKTPEELLEIARECGMKLDDAELNAVAGGAWCEDYCTDFYHCKNDGPL